MSFKEFFVHQHRGSNQKLANGKRGFTIKVRPLTEQEAQAFDAAIQGRMCAVQLTFCSRNDQFVKKEGRSQASAKEPVFINKRDLPAFIEKAENVVHADSYTDGGRQFNYLLKYII